MKKAEIKKVKTNEGKWVIYWLNPQTRIHEISISFVIPRRKAQLVRIVDKSPLLSICSDWDTESLLGIIDCEHCSNVPIHDLVKDMLKELKWYTYINFNASEKLVTRELNRALLYC
jgi:hypothetical protein